MTHKLPSMPITAARSRAVVPYVDDPSAAQSRQRRRRLFQIDQHVNAVLVAAVAATFAAHLIFADTLTVPQAAPPPDLLPSGIGSRFVSAAVTRGDLFVRVSASGTVEPMRLVDVSTELSGTIRAVHADANDRVEAGQLLAELEPATLANELRRAEAQVAAAKARVREAEAATVAASKELARKKTLAARDLAPARDLDNASASSQQTKASAEALGAELKAAEAGLAIARANLEKGRIVAPIDGIVLRRNVEPGQTVAAQLQSPVLFRIAQDLDRMQLRIDVDEADALSVREGQPATFSVQALRDRPLEARVEKLFVGPEVVQGVVTYKAILSFDNRELRLRPGMTATAEIVVESVRDKLLVPNAALRFAPPDDPARTGIVSAGSRLVAMGVGSAIADSRAPPPQPGAEPSSPSQRRLWVERNGAAQPILVEIGATDGKHSEVVSGPLAAGQRVIVDLVSDGGAGR